MRVLWLHISGLLIAVLLVASIAGSSAQEATPVGAAASATPTERSFVWDRIDVTVELREDNSLHVTERGRVDFHGGPFRSGYREIPWSTIEQMRNISVGEVIASNVQPYQYVSPHDFSNKEPKTYTHQIIGPMMRIDWSFSPATNQARTFELAFDAYGALQSYPDAAHPYYQQIRWIAVGSELTESAPVKEASMTIVLPQPVDPDKTFVQGPGGDLPEDHTKDGKTWTWRDSTLGKGDALEVRLQFEPLVKANEPS